MQTRMIQFFSLVIVLLLALAFSPHLAHAGQVSTVFLTTIDFTGTPLSTFDVGLASDQFVPFVEVDSSENIWVGRSDTGHGVNQFNPNDVVAKFTPSGNELLTVKGPMRSPESVAFDSDGNIYIGGVPDGGSFVNQIYKYDSIGNFLFSFGQVSSSEEWEALVFASGDRLFATTNNPHSVREFTTGGAQVQSVGSFDGTYRFGRGLALSPDGTILWNYQPKNGPGEDFIVAYDLNLNVLSSFGLGAFGNPTLWGLDTLSNGNLVARDVAGSRILEFSTTGTLVNEIDISSIDMGTGFRRGFAVDNNGNFLITHVVPEPVSSVLISPPSGDYVTTQCFDLTLIVEAPGFSVVGGSATLDGSDVTGALVSCVISGTLVSGGQTFRCSGLTGSFLGTGTHILDVTLDLSDGSSVNDTVTWEVKENTEP